MLLPDIKLYDLAAKALNEEHNNKHKNRMRERKENMLVTSKT